MEKAKLIVMILSLVFVTICFGASVWLVVVAPDAMTYAMVALFFLAAVWLGYNVYNMRKSLPPAPPKEGSSDRA